MPESERLQPSLIPILVRLREYATALEQAPDLTLASYLTTTLAKLNTSAIPNVDIFVLICLKDGRCLVMLDGLDEVSDPKIRKLVQQAIRSFIFDHQDTLHTTTHFNRFLITSRVAG